MALVLILSACQSSDSSDQGGGDMRLVVVNLDGPDALVQPWDGAEVVTVPCGRTEEIGDTASPQGPWHVKITNQQTGEQLFDRTVDGPDYYIRVTPGGVVSGDSPLSGPGPAGDACQTPQH